MDEVSGEREIPDRIIRPKQRRFRSRILKMTPEERLTNAFRKIDRRLKAMNRLRQEVRDIAEEEGLYIDLPEIPGSYNGLRRQ